MFSMKGTSWSYTYDEFEKSSTSALRFILRHSDVLIVRLIPQDSRALNLKLFSNPSNFAAYEPNIIE